MEISKELFKGIYNAMNQAEVFINTKEKMHPEGRDRHSDLLIEMADHGIYQGIHKSTFKGD